MKSTDFPISANLETRNTWVAAGHSVDDRMVGVMLSKNEGAAFAMRSQGFDPALLHQYPHLNNLPFQRHYTRFFRVANTWSEKTALW